MNVLLQFDYESHLLHIPDGYISDIRDTFDEFFSWLYEQEENMLETPDGHIGCAYGANDFMIYINTVILKDSHERAYFIKSGHVDKRLCF